MSEAEDKARARRWIESLSTGKPSGNAGDDDLIETWGRKIHNALLSGGIKGIKSLKQIVDEVDPPAEVRADVQLLTSCIMILCREVGLINLHELDAVTELRGLPIN
jgi:hypothetical protein